MPKFSVKKPLTVFVAMIAIIVLGVVAYLKMTPDLLPNMDFPYVLIVTTNPGASPESIEAEITKPMEQSMATLDDIKSITSSSRDSVSVVTLEFEDGVNMDTIGVDIQQKVAVLQGQWDDMVGTPYVLKINPSMLPVMVAAVAAEDMDVGELSDFVEDTLSGKLEGITGVASVDVSGLVDRELHVILSQEKLDALSEKLEEAINKQLDKAAGQLYSARKQVTDAQKAIADAERSAIGGAVDSALGTVQDSIRTMRQQQEELKNQYQNISSLTQEYITVTERITAANIRLAELGQKAEPTEEEQAEIAALQEELTALTAQRAEIQTKLAAYGTTPEKAEARLAELREAIEKVEKTLDDLSKDSTIAQISDTATDTIVGALDAMTQITAGTIQLSSALSQIESGLGTIADARKDLDEQSDMSGALSITTIGQLLTAQNFSMPAGYIDDNDGISYMVSVGDEITSREDLQDLVLIDLGMEGLDSIRLGDVADVFITDNSDSIYAKLNGNNGVIATFTKQSNYATAEVSNNIQERFEKLEEEYPNIAFVSLMDQGDYIYLIVNSIFSSLGWGALFSVLVLYIFLRDLRPTVITLVSIPISVIFAIVLMYFSGVTINMISLSGLAVAVGMLVDNSVVVIENIYRLRAKGATIVQAAVSGAGQVLGAITASTLTTVCVFIPIVFVEGITRKLFTDLALTMTFSLMASLVVALTLVPAMAAGMLKKEKVQKAGILDKVYPAYRKAISWSLGHKAIVLVLAFLLLLGSAGAALSRGFTFMPEMDMNMISASITMPENCTLEEAIALADEACERARTVKGVEAVGAMMGGSGFSMMGGGGGSYDVTVYITMPEGASGMAAGKEIEALCADMDCEVRCDGMSSMTSMMTGGTGISLNVYGEDMEDLQTAVHDIAARMEQVEGTKEVSDGLENAAPAVHIVIDRVAAMQHGMTVAQVYMQIAQALTTTANGADMTLDEQKVEVIIESIEDSRVTLEKLEDLEIKPDTSMAAAMGGSADASGMSALMGGSEEKGDDSFRLGEIASVEKAVSLSSISRVEQRRCLTVTSQIADGYNVTLVNDQVEKALKTLQLPNGITYSFGGENEAIMKAMKQLALMMLLGIILVYFIMVAQFQSLKSPFIVMFTIPLAFTGGFIALLLAGIEVSVVSLIGFVMLVGIIVNNGIVLVDYINQQRLGGMERREAIIDAGVTRMRPILMTSLTTILGLIVMALARNAGTALMQPVALVCIGGLLYATLMTLFVVPCMYDIVNKKELRKVDEKELELLDI